MIKAESHGGVVRSRTNKSADVWLNCTFTGRLTVLCCSSQDIATMQLCANKLDKKDFFGKSDPFLVFYRSNEDGT